MSGPANSSKRRVYIDLTHLGRHVTGIERISIDLFEKVDFADADVRHVRSSGVLTMILKQQFLLPLLAVLHANAMFVFPGFPPSPMFTLIRERVIFYVHDVFLITRKRDLSLKAKLYMAWPFKFALTRLRHFFVNSQKTKAEVLHYACGDAVVRLYRPAVQNAFGLEAQNRLISVPQTGDLSIVMIGTIEPRKNYAAAIDILDMLRKTRFPKARLHIIGRSGWGQDADRLAAHSAVTLHGYASADEAKRILESSDLYLCTSHDEGLGLPLIEAQYAGLQVVAPDAPVFREVLGRSGIFIDPSRPEHAAEIISGAISIDAWRKPSAEAAIANIARWNGVAQADGRMANTIFSREFNTANAQVTTAVSAGR